MNVDEYHKKHGLASTQGFWGIPKVIRIPESNARLYRMVEKTILEINAVYIQFTFGWMKQKRPELWEKIKEVEYDINVAVICENEESLKEALEEFYQVWLEGIIEFDASGRRFVPF